MALDIKDILASANGRQFDDFAEHVHPQWTDFDKQDIAAPWLVPEHAFREQDPR